MARKTVKVLCTLIVDEKREVTEVTPHRLTKFSIPKSGYFVGGLGPEISTTIL